MEHILLDAYTERLLLKKTRELERIIPYDIYIQIKNIVCEAVNKHFICRDELNEILRLLQSLPHKNSSEYKVIDRVAKFKNSCEPKLYRCNNTMHYYQIFDYIVVRYRKIITLMLDSKVDAEKKLKINEKRIGI